MVICSFPQTFKHELDWMIGYIVFPHLILWSFQMRTTWLAQNPTLLEYFGQSGPIGLARHPGAWVWVSAPFFLCWCPNRLIRVEVPIVGWSLSKEFQWSQMVIRIWMGTSRGCMELVRNRLKLVASSRSLGFVDESVFLSDPKSNVFMVYSGVICRLYKSPIVNHRHVNDNLW